MSETFCLDKDYIGFNANSQAVKIATIYRASPSRTSLIVGFGVIVGIIVFLYLLFFLFPDWLGKGWGLRRIEGFFAATFCVLWAIYYLDVRRRHWQLVEHGVTIDGEVTGSKYSGDMSTVMVTYKFISPTFEILKGKQETTMNLVESPLYFQLNKIKAIKPGTPITVLYANRRNFVAL